MSTKTSKPKTVSLNVVVAGNGKSANAVATKSGKPKKSMYEKWIEKYGIDDSKEGKMLLRAWHRTFDNHNKKTTD